MWRLYNIALVVLAVALAACSDTPTSTTTNKLGKATIDEFKTNPGYSVWFSSGYDGFPGAATDAQTRFNAAVQTIKDNLDATQHKVIMVVKPSCSCQKTQTFMPQVIKTLDQAGVPAANVDIYVTDASFNGLGSIKTDHSIASAPTFIVLKNGVELGRIVEADLATPIMIDQQIASFFNVP